ncbi:MAG: hypothetical protein WA786_03640 [Acidimicrobiales bacterium]
MNLNLKKVSRRLVVELAVVIAFASFNVSFPKHDSTSQAWKFVLKHPSILLHVIVGTIVFVESIIFVVRAIRGRDRFWITLASLGLALVLLAFAAGENYVSTQRDSALTLMGNAAAGALFAYGFGWYWGHRRSRATNLDIHSPSDQPLTTPTHH